VIRLASGSIPASLVTPLVLCSSTSSGIRAQPDQSGAVLCALPYGDVADLPCAIMIVPPAMERLDTSTTWPRP
jgi:hypothetical protein